MERPDAASPSFDDPESADATALDLSPRSVAGRAAKRRTPWLAYVALVAILGGLTLVLVNGLSDATTFFYNVDAAVADRQDIGDRRIRLQGNVIDGSQVDRPGGTTFDLKYGDATVRVNHTGDLPPLFQPAIPVVAEGRFDGTEFDSDRVLVKHDENYDEANPDRLSDAEADAEQQISPTP